MNRAREGGLVGQDGICAKIAKRGEYGIIGGAGHRLVPWGQGAGVVVSLGSTGRSGWHGLRGISCVVVAWHYAYQ